MTVAPLDQARLAALVEAGSPAMVFDRLDEPGEYADVIAALRGFGQQSACLLPLSTALGPVGLIAFASSREGTYCQVRHQLPPAHRRAGCHGDRQRPPSAGGGGA